MYIGLRQWSEESLRTQAQDSLGRVTVTVTVRTIVYLAISYD